MASKKAAHGEVRFAASCRDEATRTPDPYVPNVVRYQLRYIPILRKRVQNYNIFLESQNFFAILRIIPSKNAVLPSLLTFCKAKAGALIR